MTPGPRCIAWLSPAQADLVRAVAQRAGISIIAAGGPGRLHASAAAALGVPSVDDLRRVLHESDADAIFIADPGDFGSAPGGQDARAVLAARARNTRVLSMGPIPRSLLDLHAAGWLEGGASSWVRVLSRPRLARAMREAADALAHFGPVRTLAIEAWAAGDQCSLTDRLFGAVDLAMAHLGEPTVVHAVALAPRPGSPRRDGPDLAAFPSIVASDAVVGDPTLGGEWLVHLRFPAAAASIVVGTLAARWTTQATYVGPGGRLRVYDDGFEWADPDGSKRDELRFRPRGELRAVTDAPGTPRMLHDRGVTALADAAGRLLDPAVPDEGPADLSAVLAVVEAAALSARTGHPESPTTIDRMARG